MQAKLSQTGSLRYALFGLALVAQQNIELVTQPSSARFQDLLKFLLEFNFVARNFLFLSAAYFQGDSAVFGAQTSLVGITSYSVIFHHCQHKNLFCHGREVFL